MSYKVDVLHRELKVSSAIIAKVAIEKVQLSPTNSLFYSLLAFKYYFSFFSSSFLSILNERENIEFPHIL
jgi:hypothetical protein